MKSKANLNCNHHKALSVLCASNGRRSCRDSIRERNSVTIGFKYINDIRVIALSMHRRWHHILEYGNGKQVIDAVKSNIKQLITAPDIVFIMRVWSRHSRTAFARTVELENAKKWSSAVFRTRYTTVAFLIQKTPSAGVNMCARVL